MKRMNKVYLLEVDHAAVPQHRVMVEAAGPASARAIYAERIVKVRPLSAGEAVALARADVPMLEAERESPSAA